MRFNSTEIVSTVEVPTDNLQRESDTSYIKKYLLATPATQTGPPWQTRRSLDIVNSLPIPGFMTLQLLVDRWIINRTEPLPRFESQNDLRLDSAATKVAQTMLLMSSYMLAPVQVSSLLAEVTAPPLTPANITRRLALLNDLVAWAQTSESFAPQQVDLVPFPITGYTSNDFFEIAQSVLAFFLTICLLFPVSRLIRGLVAEKETKLREGMKMMGLSDAALLGSWMTTYIIMFFVTSVLITLIGLSSLWRSSNRGIILITFWLYGISCCSFSFLISVFFSRAKTASTLGVVVFLGGACVRARVCVWVRARTRRHGSRGGTAGRARAPPLESRETPADMAPCFPCPSPLFRYRLLPLFCARAARVLDHHQDRRVPAFPHGVRLRRGHHRRVRELGRRRHVRQPAHH